MTCRCLLLSIAGILGCGILAQTPICVIQGAGTSSAYLGQMVSTTGIVTGSYEGSAGLNGFFLEDPDCDALTGTSNGIFVYAPGVTNVALGDVLQLTAEVDEYQGCTELLNISSVVFLGTATISPTDIFLPITSLSHWERYEGMLLRFPQPLEVTDNDTWAQYGELLLAPSRLWQPTHLNDPNDADPNGNSFTGASNAAVINGAVSANARNAILLDDGRTNSYPDPPPLMGPEGTVRCGSSVTNLTGVLHYAFSSYRLHPVGPVPLAHEPRPEVPQVGGDLRIAALNVHNYWSTLGGFGASTNGELLRQRTKLIAALFAMDADAYMLCEVQDNDVAWVQLIDALNALYGTTEYVGLEQDESFGTKSVIFYRPWKLTPATPLYSIYTSTFERAHITQGFQVNATGGRFLLSGVHLHSKLCDNASGPDLDQGDGQGCYNAHRRDQAAELADHWTALRASTGIDAQLIVGDFNAYFQEDPLDFLRADGLATVVPDDAANYTYRYGGVFGALDYALATPAMVDAITGAKPWAINSDEPPALDYGDGNISFYQANAFRSSDHDPVLVGVEAEALEVGLPVNGAFQLIDFRLDEQQRMARWEGEGIAEIDVLDALGRTVLHIPRARRSADLGALTSGCYLWRCSMVTGAGVITGRFIIR
jgi:uncharacterized protein